MPAMTPQAKEYWSVVSHKKPGRSKKTDSLSELLGNLILAILPILDFRILNSRTLRE